MLNRYVIISLVVLLCGFASQSYSQETYPLLDDYADQIISDVNYLMQTIDSLYIMYQISDPQGDTLTASTFSYQYGDDVEQVVQGAISRSDQLIEFLSERPTELVEYIPSITPFKSGNAELLDLTEDIAVFSLPENLRLVASARGTIESITQNSETTETEIVIFHPLGFKSIYTGLIDTSVRKGQDIRKYGEIGICSGETVQYKVTIGTNQEYPLSFLVLNKGFDDPFEIEDTMIDFLRSGDGSYPLYPGSADSEIEKINDYNRQMFERVRKLRELIFCEDNLNTMVDAELYAQLNPSARSVLRLSLSIKLMRQNVANLITFVMGLRPIVDHIPNNRPLSGGGISRGISAHHHGVDYYQVKGTPVHSTAAGEVYDAGYHHQKGNYVQINHDYGFSTRYYHFDTSDHAQVGDQVRNGDVIGLVGTTGRSTGYHLHYEVRWDGRVLNPLHFTKLEQLVY